MPPLYDPRASLYCTLYPLNILIFPLSILTGKWTLMTFFGSRSIAWIPSSSSRCSAAILSCSSALRKASGFFSGNDSTVTLRIVFTVFQRQVASRTHRRPELSKLRAPILRFHHAARDEDALRPEPYRGGDVFPRDDSRPAEQATRVSRLREGRRGLGDELGLGLRDRPPCPDKLRRLDGEELGLQSRDLNGLFRGLGART